MTILTYHRWLPFSIFFLIPESRRREHVLFLATYIRQELSYQSSGCSASGSGMNSGPLSIHPSGLTASASGILGGASSSQSSGFVAVGSGILESGFKNKYGIITKKIPQLLGRGRDAKLKRTSQNLAVHVSFLITRSQIFHQRVSAAD